MMVKKLGALSVPLRLAARHLLGRGLIDLTAMLLDFSGGVALAVNDTPVILACKQVRH